MGMRLYDTARGEVVPFEPGPTASIYVCGITPYDATHLGHAFTYLTFDLVVRRLEDLGHEVCMVRNVTDVDDSILGKARELRPPITMPSGTPIPIHNCTHHTRHYSLLFVRLFRLGVRFFQCFVVLLDGKFHRQLWG